MNPSDRIDALIAHLTDWRSKTLAGVRKSILAADRDIVEEWKWMGSPVWSRDGMIAVANAHKEKVKLTFMHGAKLADPDRLFNAGLGGNAWRAIDFVEGDKINERALKNLVRAAIGYNQTKLKKNKAPAGTRAKVRKTKEGLTFRTSLAAWLDGRPGPLINMVQPWTFRSAPQNPATPHSSAGPAFSACDNRSKPQILLQ